MPCTCARPTTRPPCGWATGHALALSPDGKWALSTPQTEPAELVLLPTGAGQARRLATGSFANVLRAAWLPGGERLVLAANEPGRAARLYVQPVAGGAPRPFTPEGVGPDWAVEPDGARGRGDGPGPPPAGLRHRRGCAGARAGPGRARGRRPDPLLARRARAVRPGPRGRPGVGDRTHRRVDRRALGLARGRPRRPPSARSASRASSSRPTGSRTSTRTCGCSTSSSSWTG